MPRRFVASPFAVAVFAALQFASPLGAGELNTAIQSISPDDVREYIEVLADDSLEGREAGSRGSRAAAAYLAKKMTEFGLKPGGDDGTFAQNFRNGSYRNLLAVLPGSDAELKREYVLVGAHYDHVGYGTSRNSRGPWGRIHNGADDNASGVSGVLETAQALAQLEPPPKRTILFAFWDGEEKGLLGSKHWGARPTVPLEAVCVAFNADMLGRLRDDTLHVYGTRTAPGLRRWLCEHNQGTDLRLDFSWELKAQSDHYPLVDQGVPALMLHTGLHDDWHRPSDDADRINHDGVVAAARLLFSLVLDAGNRRGRFPFRGEARFEGPADLAQLEQPVGPRAARLGISWHRNDEDPPGVLVTDVTAGSAADRAGMQSGDRLLRFAGQDASDERRLGVAIWAAASPAMAVLDRPDGQRLQISVDLDGLPLRYGISWREDPGEPGTVLLTEVVPQSAAWLAGLQVGDRIYRVGGATFDDGEELARLLASLPGPVPVQIERQGRLRTLAIDVPSDG